MSRRSARFTQAEVARALRAIEQTGMRSAVEIGLDGTIRIVPVCSLDRTPKSEHAVVDSAAYPSTDQRPGNGSRELLSGDDESGSQSHRVKAKASRDPELERLSAMSQEELSAELQNRRAEWEAEVLKSALNKREQKALRQLSTFGTSWARWNQIKDCGIDTIERLVLRGFIETKAQDRFPDRIGDLRLTEAGSSAAHRY